MTTAEPALEKRVYYRHVDTGQRAYVVERGGTERLRIDHGPNVEVIVSLDSSKWTVDRDVRPINRAHLAEVAFAADRALCLRLALHVEARVAWRDLTDKQRADFIDRGPSSLGAAHSARLALYKSILAALSPYTSR